MTLDAVVSAVQEPTWEKVGWQPHAVQKEILLDDTRNQVLAAGRRAGKSQTFGYSLLPYAFKAWSEEAWLESKGLRREYWIVGPEYSDAEKEFRVLYNACRRLGLPFDRPGTYNNPQTGDMHISLWGGKFLVNALSAKYPETLVGEGVSGVVLSEAAKLKPSVYPKYIRPTLADFTGWTRMGSTPEGRNWFYRMWERGQDPDRPDWKSWRSPSWANPYVYRNMRVFGADAVAAVKRLQDSIRNRRIPSGHSSWAEYGESLGVDPEIVSLALDLSEELFNQEVAAEFNEFVGRVFKDFDEEIHVGDFKLDRGWKTYAALDYGFTNPMVWLLIQVDPFNTNIRIIDEYYERGRTTEEAAEEIKSRGLAPSSLIGMYPDPAEPDRSRTLSNLLQVPAYGGTGGAIQDRLEWIRRKLKPAGVISHLDTDHPEWVPQLQVHRRCKETIRELGTYRYPKTAEEAEERGKSAPEAPLKKDDHTPEALGRFMIGHFGSPWRIRNAPGRARPAVFRRSRR